VREGRPEAELALVRELEQIARGLIARA
jgi:hypothetical protein